MACQVTHVYIPLLILNVALYTLSVCIYILFYIHTVVTLSDTQTQTQYPRTTHTHRLTRYTHKQYSPIVTDSLTWSNEKIPRRVFSQPEEDTVRRVHIWYKYD